ncbi:MAG: protein translocase SEC61 complex subunit gamma [Candidatus Marsarchaeota archaeon]|jgi:protein translocase SEC61 complex gamma subunit|nr:protein translocase SEC61 complex subunit gamma [Candidatus Marsarchaeota archaeon]
MKLNISGRLREFFKNARHVTNISYRPTNDEFKSSAKIIILGIILIGLIGFIIAVLVSLIISGNLSLV